MPSPFFSAEISRRPSATRYCRGASSNLRRYLTVADPSLHPRSFATNYAASSIRSHRQVTDLRSVAVNDRRSSTFPK